MLSLCAVILPIVESHGQLKVEKVTRLDEHGVAYSHQRASVYLVCGLVE